MSVGQRGRGRIWALIGLGAAVYVAEACAQAEGIGADNPPAGGGGSDASLGGSSGAGGAPTGGAAGMASGGVAGAAGSLTGGSAGASGGSSGTGASGGAGGTGGATGGSGGTTGGSGGATGGSGGTTGGTGGATGGSGGTTGGTGGATGGSGGTTGGAGGTGGATGGSGGSGGCPITTYPFTGCPTGWTTAGNNNDWQCGVPSVGPPNGDHTGGGQCWGTKLTGNANNCADSTLTSPIQNLSAYNGQALRLRFWHFYEFRACNPSGFLCALPCALDKSTYSGGVVEVSTNGSTWTKITPTTGYNGTAIDCYYLDPEAGATCSPCSLDGQVGFGGATAGWQQVEFDISSYAVSTFQFRFHFASYGAEPLCHPNKPGWYVDDVSIVKLSCP
ncbi:MAG: hypothetical protein HS104_09390 [Polyangiaceae bacterium]|nr:hypothetical protein [Polyangiaceae bacterium]MCL4755767.1 hypothetical protein [Myxococcales bacterium]